MIRFYAKIGTTVLLLLTIVISLWAVAAYVAANRTLHHRYASEVQRLTPAIAQLLKDNQRGQKQFEYAFAQFAHFHDIAVVDLSNDITHQTNRLFSKPDSEWHIKLSYPINADGIRTGTLVLWLDSGILIRDLFGKNSIARTIGWLLCLGLLMISVVFLYIHTCLIEPIRSLHRFADALGHGDTNVRIDPSTFSYSGWHMLAQKLNGLTDAINDANDTLTILFNASKTLTSRLDINEITNVVLDAVQRKFDQAPCAVMFLEDDGYLRIRNQRDLSPNFVRDLRTLPGE